MGIERMENERVPVDSFPPEAEVTKSEERGDSSAREEVEDIERAFDSMIETFIATHRVENAGSNGLIMRLSLDAVSQEAQGILHERGIPFDEDEAAVKILKVYNPEKGKKEYEMLQRAFGLIENSPDKEQLAKIPKPMLYREIDIGPDTREHLRQYGARVDEKAAVIMMEQVPGKDIAAHMYDFILRELKYDPAVIEEMGFDEKQQLVADALHFRIPGGKSVVEGEREFERIRVMAENGGLLTKYLSDHDFRVHSQVIEKIRRTVRLFHQNGLYHNDLYERNIMATSNLGDEKAEVYVIDFGLAGEQDQSKSSGEMRINDESILMRLQAIMTLSERKILEREALKSELYKFKERLIASGSWDKEYEKFRTDFLANPQGFLEGRFALGSANSVELDKLILFAEQIGKEHSLDDRAIDELERFIRKHRTDRRAYVQRRFSFFDSEYKKSA